MVFLTTCTLSSGQMKLWYVSALFPWQHQCPRNFYGQINLPKPKYRVFYKDPAILKGFLLEINKNKFYYRCKSNMPKNTFVPRKILICSTLKFKLKIEIEKISMKQMFFFSFLCWLYDKSCLYWCVLCTAFSSTGPF